MPRKSVITALCFALGLVLVIMYFTRGNHPSGKRHAQHLSASRELTPRELAEKKIGDQVKAMTESELLNPNDYCSAYERHGEYKRFRHSGYDFDPPLSPEDIEQVIAKNGLWPALINMQNQRDSDFIHVVKLELYNHPQNPLPTCASRPENPMDDVDDIVLKERLGGLSDDQKLVPRKLLLQVLKVESTPVLSELPPQFKEGGAAFFWRLAAEAYKLKDDELSYLGLNGKQIHDLRHYYDERKNNPSVRAAQHPLISKEVGGFFYVAYGKINKKLTPIMTNILKHIWEHLLKAKWTYLVIGCIAIVVAVMASGSKGGPQAPSGPAATPASGAEGTQITMSLSSAQTGATPAPSEVTAVFTDPNEHGYYAVQQGGGMFVTYDPKTNLQYSTPATKNADGSYSFNAPAGMCGLIIQSAQEPTPPPKVVTVTLVGPDGKPIPGAQPHTFQLQCDKYTLNIKIVSSKDPVLPDGIDSAKVTATLSVTGPAQFINGQRIKPGQNKPILTTPLGLIMVNFSTNLGVLAQGNPANIKTDMAGNASVDISSSDAGIAKVRAVALAIGDAFVNVHFPPKITAVKEDFVQPVSPTNYVLTTIPKNAKDLTFDWQFVPAAGTNCGHLTGAASGKGESTNGFYHGPQDNYPNGCPEDWEMASQMKVTVTDKDGQSETKIFTARGFEGQGAVKL